MSIIKSLAVGNGDMFYIEHNTDSFTIIDCCLPDDKRGEILKEIASRSSQKGLTRFISTHPDQDHICGLRDLDDLLAIRNFYCVENQATKPNGTYDFERYCKVREDKNKTYHLAKGCKRKWINDEDDTRKSSGISIHWPVTTNEAYMDALEDARLGLCPNNISTIVRYGTGNSSFMWMGDMDTSFMETIEGEVSLPQTAIVFAPHHGGKSGRIPASWLKKINPQIIIVGEGPSEDLHYYSSHNTITQNWAGDIVFEANENGIHIFTSNPNYTADFLDDWGMLDTHGKYIGTLYLS